MLSCYLACCFDSEFLSSAPRASPLDCTDQYHLAIGSKIQLIIYSDNNNNINYVPLVKMPIALQVHQILLPVNYDVQIHIAQVSQTVAPLCGKGFPLSPVAHCVLVFH